MSTNLHEGEAIASAHPAKEVGHTTIIGGAGAMAKHTLEAFGLSQHLKNMDVIDGTEHDVRECLQKVFVFNFGSDYAAREVIAHIDDDERGISSCPILLGEYPIIKCMGKGGSSTVYLVHGKHGPEVLKILECPEQDKERWAQALEKEIALMWVMKERPSLHGRVPDILTDGSINGRRFYTMRYVDGVDSMLLLRALEGNPPPAELIDNIAAQISHTLMLLHEELEVLHRDVKPHNIIVGADGSVCLIDFGLAASFGGKTQSVFSGTPDYMSVGTAQAELHLPERDTFALGVSVYEYLMGSALRNLREEGFAGRPSEKLFADPVLGKFLSSMTDPTIAARPSMREVRDFFGARAGISEEQRDQPLRLPPSPTLKQDPYAPTYATPLDLLHALKMAYPGEAAVRKGQVLTKTIEFFNPDKKKLSRREVLGLIAASTLGAYYALSRKEEHQPVVAIAPSVPVASSLPPAPEAPKIVALDAGGDLKIVDGNIVLFANKKKPLVLSNEEGVHAMVTDQNGEAKKQQRWGSVHLVPLATIKDVLGFDDKAVAELQFKDSVLTYSYFSTDTTRSEALVFLNGIGYFFRTPDGKVTYFRSSRNERVRCLFTIEGVERGGTGTDMYRHPLCAAFIASLSTNVDLTARRGSQFRSPNNRPQEDYINGIKGQAGILQMSVQKASDSRAST